MIAWLSSPLVTMNYKEKEEEEKKKNITMYEVIARKESLKHCFDEH